jgi:hypothetical protein
VTHKIYNHVYNQFRVITSSGNMVEREDMDWIDLTQNRERFHLSLFCKRNKGYSFAKNPRNFLTS